MEKLNKKLGHGPIFGGLITDPKQAKILELEKRIKTIETLLGGVEKEAKKVKLKEKVVVEEPK